MWRGGWGSDGCGHPVVRLLSGYRHVSQSYERRCSCGPRYPGELRIRQSDGSLKHTRGGGFPDRTRRGSSMSGMSVDPAILRGFAESSDAVSRAISNAAIPEGYEAMAACMPGSATAYAASKAADTIREPIRTVAGHYSSMAVAARNGAGEYVATDDELASRLNRIAADR